MVPKKCVLGQRQSSDIIFTDNRNVQGYFQSCNHGGSMFDDWCIVHYIIDNGVIAQFLCCCVIVFGWWIQQQW